MKTIDTASLQTIALQPAVDYADEDIVIIDDLHKYSESADLKVDFLLIAIVTQGSALLKAGGKQHEAKQHDIFICQPNTIVSDCMFSIDFAAKAVCLSRRAVHNIFHVNDVCYMSYFLKHQPVVHIGAADMENFERTYDLLNTKLQRKEMRFKKQVVTGLTSSFLFSLLEILEDTHPTAGKDISIQRSQVLFKQFIDLLGSLDKKPRSVEFYSERLCISSKYLTTVCKDVSGQTAYHWILQYVVEDIERSLSHSDMSLKEISNHFDFPNVSFFGKFVKKRLGMSPKDYRAKRGEQKK